MINNTGMSAECAIWYVCPWVGSGLPASEGEHCMSPLLEILLPAQLLEYGSSVCSTKHSSRASLPFWDFRHWKEVVGDPKPEAERPVCCSACVWDMHMGVYETGLRSLKSGLKTLRIIHCQIQSKGDPDLLLLSAMSGPSLTYSREGCGCWDRH